MQSLTDDCITALAPVKEHSHLLILGTEWLPLRPKYQRGGFQARQRNSEDSTS